MEEKNNSTQIIKYNPLLNCPILTVEDIEKSILPEPIRQSIIASQNFPRIKSIDTIESRNGLIDIIAANIWESGIKFSDDPDKNAKEQMILINYMVEEIKRDFSYLTLEEVRIAFRKGLRGHYGDVYGLNVRMMYGWLDCYVEETRKTAISELRQLEAKAENNSKSNIKEEDKKYWRSVWLDTCVNAYEEYVKTDKTTFNDIGNNLYKYIRIEMKLVDLTNEETHSIWARAVKKYKTEISVEATRGGYAKRIEAKLALEKLEKNDTTENDKIQLIAKKMSLSLLFKKMKIAKVDFKKSIIEHEKYDYKKWLEDYIESEKKKAEEIAKKKYEENKN